jgi:hypothetical protein
MTMLTRDQKSEEIMRLEILLTRMEKEGKSFNECLLVLRKIQKLRDSL